MGFPTTLHFKEGQYVLIINDLMIVLDLPADLRLLLMADIMDVGYHRGQSSLIFFVFL